jgi:hypothetical protein
MRFIFLLLGLLAGLSPAVAQETTASPTNAPSAQPPPALKEVSPGVFEYNGIKLDKKNHRISFPGSVNQNRGLVEYLLVNEMGKVHESLFATKIAPRDIHLALLLIGLQVPSSTNAKESVPPSAIDTAYLQSAPKLKGPSVKLSIAWTQDGKQKKGSPEDWILNLKTKHAMSNGPWTYNGSMIENGVFLADQEFSIIAVITDPTALVNNPRPGYDDDQIWQIQDKVVPAIDTPVEITITLADSAAAKP